MSGKVRRKWEGQEGLARPHLSPTCGFVEVLVVYDDTFTHLLKIHAVQVSGHSVPAGLDGAHRGISLLLPWVTESRLEVVEAVWAAMYSGKP